MAVRHYDTLSEYLTAEGWKRVAPHTGSNEKAAEAYASITMKGEDDKTIHVFGLERVTSRSGINAIELAVVPPVARNGA